MAKRELSAKAQVYGAMHDAMMQHHFKDEDEECDAMAEKLLLVQ